MVCTEYHPAYTHSDWPDCKNCEYKSYFGCENVNVNVALGRIAKEKKDKEK